MGSLTVRGGQGLPVTLYVAGLLASGTSATLICKAMLTMQVVVDGVPETFAKPAFCTFLVFVGYSCTFPIGVRQGLGWTHVRWDTCSRCLALSCLDIASVTLLQSGLVFIPASSSLMLRMSSIAFTAFFRRVIFGRHLLRKQLLGLGLLALALSIVTWSVWQRSVGPTALLGCGLTVLAQFIRGLILVCEEHLMGRLPPFGIIFGEGILAGIVMLAVVFPALSWLPGEDRGALERLPDTLEMIRCSHTLAILVFSYVLTIVLESSSAIMITALLSSVHRSFLQFGVRIMTVWSASLLLCWLSGGRYGEPVDGAAGVQLLGFAVLLASATLYFGAPGEGAKEAPAEPLLRGPAGEGREEG